MSRLRFCPVKATSDPLALRSDLDRVTEGTFLVLDDSRRGRPPVVEWGPQYSKMLAEFERWFAGGAPSLVACDSLWVSGSVAGLDNSRAGVRTRAKCAWN